MRNSVFIVSVFILLSCSRDNDLCGDNAEKLYRVEYYSNNGALNGNFKNLGYNNNLISQIELISGNYQLITYENNRVVKVENRLLGVPFPISSMEYKYAAGKFPEQVIINSQGVTGQAEQMDTILFNWVGSTLTHVISKSTRLGQIIMQESILYSYSGDNISKCVFEGGYFGYNSGTVIWKDSLEFEYDALPNRFADNGISFYLQEFGFIHKIIQQALRVEYDSYMDPFWIDPALFAFIASKNNVVVMKSNGGRNILRYGYIGLNGSNDKITEIKVNNRTVSRYLYKRF